MGYEPSYLTAFWTLLLTICVASSVYPCVQWPCVDMDMWALSSLNLCWYLLDLLVLATSCGWSFTQMLTLKLKCLYEVWKLHLHFEGLKNTILWKSKIFSNWTEMNCYQWLKMPCEWRSSLISFPKCGALGKVNTLLCSVCFKNNLPDHHKHNITSLSHASQQHY